MVYRENFQCESRAVTFRHKVVGTCGYIPGTSQPKAIAKMGNRTMIALGDTFEECSALLERMYASGHDDE